MLEIFKNRWKPIHLKIPNSKSIEYIVFYRQIKTQHKPESSSWSIINMQYLLAHPYILEVIVFSNKKHLGELRFLLDNRERQN